MNDITSKYTIKTKTKTQKEINKIKIKHKLNKKLYSIHNKLNSKIPNQKFINIFVVLFKINTFTNDLIMPSLEFLLYKNKKNEMIFPFFKIKNKQKMNEKIIKYSNFLLHSFNYENISLKTHGYIDIDTNLFSFIELKQNNINNFYISNQQSKKKLWWVTHDEIRNIYLMNYKINNSVIYIFNNYRFLNNFNLENEYFPQTLFICDSCDNILNILRSKFIDNKIFKPLNICIKDAIKKKISKPVLIRATIFSKQNITKPTKIGNLFRILPRSLHFIKINPSYRNLFKIK